MSTPSGGADAGGTPPPADAAASRDGWNGGSNDSGSGGACAPGDVATYHPTYRMAAVQLGACTAPQVQAYYNACFGPSKSTGDCEDFRTNFPDCAGCIVTPETASSYGPIIEHTGFVSTNVAGCIEVTVDEEGTSDAGASELTCARAVEALDGCELAACEANCAVTDAASLAQLSDCTADADAMGCATFAAAAACAEPGSDAAVPVPQTCLETDFESFYLQVVPLFCVAAPALDAGAGAPVPPLGDASAAAD